MKIPIDVLIFIMYIRLMIYFVMVKQARLKENLIRFTCMYKMVVVIAFSVGVLAFYSTISQLVYLLLIYLFKNDSDEENLVNNLYDIERKIVWPIIDFTMALAMLYLFYSLGLKTVNLENQGKNNMRNGSKGKGKQTGNQRNNSLSQLISQKSDTGTYE